MNRSIRVAQLLTDALRCVGIALYGVGLHRAIIRWRRGQLRVLAYHACDPHESDFTAGLQANTTPDELAGHLDFYARHYRVISLEEVEAGRVPSYAAVITFDDGYRSVLEHALPLLCDHGMPATVFLVTRVVGNQRLVWVNELNWMLRCHPTIAQPLVTAIVGAPVTAKPEELIDAVRRCCDTAAIEAVLHEIRAAIGLDATSLAAREALYLTWEDIAVMKRRGITFGNHTATHASLPRLSAAAQRWEIEQAQRALDTAACHPFWLAFPFGDQAPSSRAAAREAGCTITLGVGNTSGPPGSRHIGRTPVRASSEASLFAQIEVVEPLKAWLRGILRRTPNSAHGLPRDVAVHRV